METYKDLATVISAVALFVSIVALVRSWKAISLQNRLNELEISFREMDLEDRRSAEKSSMISRVSVKAMTFSDKSYRLRIANIGRVDVLNTSYELINDKNNVSGLFMHDKEPYEILKPGESYDEVVVLCMGFPSKFEIKAQWYDIDGAKRSEKFLLSF